MAKTKTISEDQLPRPSVDPESDQDAHEREAIKMLSSVALLALPVPLMQRLSAEAARRNMRLAELLNVAVEDYLKRTDPDKQPVRLVPPEER
jgi:hypothetical protein